MKKAETQVFVQDPAVYLEKPFLKDSFTKVYEILEKEKILSVLDIGCASGDFIHFLPEKIRATGVDISSSLIETAKSRVRRPRTRFIQADILKNTARKKIGDDHEAVTLLGTLHTFLDFRPLLKQVLALKPRLVLVHSPFNEVDVDARHYHRVSDGNDFQCGYAVFSMKTVGEYLQKIGVQQFEFIPFEMRTDLVKHKTNPLRNYHVRIENGERYLTNGIGLLFKEYFLLIKTSW